MLHYADLVLLNNFFTPDRWLEDEEDQIDEDTGNSAGGNGRQTTGEEALQDGEGQEATRVADVTADANDEDDSAESQL